MVDHTTGSFGYNPLSNSFSNIGGMYMLGGQNINNNYTPNISSMYGSSSQMYFNPYSVEPVGFGYQSPQQAMHQYGLMDVIQHGIIGKPRPLGLSPLDSMIAREEYKKLAGVSIGSDIAGMAIGVGLGAAGVSAGMGAIGMGLGAAALAVPAAIAYGAETHIENYKRTQRVGSIFSNISRGDGSVGLMGREAATVTKMIDKAASNDILLSSDDYVNALSAAKDTGMLAQVSDVKQIEGKFKELTKVLKITADLMGSTDLKETMEQISKFNRLGFSITSAGMSVGNVAMAGKFAGMSQQASMDSFNADVMSGMTYGVDARLIYQDSIRDKYSMKAVQQAGFMSNMMNDPRTMDTAAREVRGFMHTLAERRTGLTRDKELLYADFKARKDGTSIQSVLDDLSNMSDADKIKTINSFDGGVGYMAMLSDKNLRGAHIRRIKGVENLNFETDFEKNFKRYKELSKRTGQEINVNNMAAYMQLGMDEKLSTEAVENLKGQIGYALKYGLEAFRKNQEVGEKMVKRKAIIDTVMRNREEDAVYGSVKKFIKGVGYGIQQFVGGYDSAGETQDMARQAYGNYANGEFGKRDQIRYDGSSMSTQERVEKLAHVIKTGTALGKIKREDKDIKLKDYTYMKYRRITGRNAYGGDDGGGMLDYMTDMISMSPTDFTDKYQGGENFMGSLKNIANTALYFGTNLLTMMNPYTLALNAGIKLYNSLSTSSATGLYKANKRANKAIYKEKLRGSRVNAYTEDIDDKRKLEAMMMAESLSEESGKSYEAAYEISTAFQSRKKDYEYVYNYEIDQIKGGFEYDKNKVYSTGEAKSAYKRLKELKKDIGSKLAGLSKTQIGAKLIDFKKRDKDKLIGGLSESLENAGGDWKVAAANFREKYSGVISRSDDALMEIYSTLDGTGDVSKIIGEALAGNTVSPKVIADFGISNESIRDADTAVGFIAHLDGKDNKNELYNELKAATIAGNKEEIAKIVNKSGIKGESKLKVLEAAYNIAELDEKTIADSSGGTMTLSAEDHRAGVWQKGELRNIKASKEEIDYLSKSTGLSAENVKKLMDVATIKDPKKRFEEMKKLRGSDDAFNKIGTIEDFRKTMAKSQMFNDTNSGKEMLDKGMGGDEIAAKSFDELKKMNDKLDSINEGVGGPKR